jgi:RecA/RadA recombinase
MAGAKKVSKVKIDEDTEPVAVSKPKKKKVESEVKGPSKDMAAALRGKFGDAFCETIEVDPDKPIESATAWLTMRDWWQRLTGTIGIAGGHITVVQGKPNTSKTTIVMESICEAQKQGWYTVIIDSEYKFGFERLRQFGADISKLIVLKCATLEECFTKLERTMAGILEEDPDGKILFVWDSIGMTPSKAEEYSKKGAEDNQPAVAARVIKRNMRRLVSKIAREKVAVVVVNHVYDKVGTMSFGEATTGYGGKGLYYAAVLVLETKRTGSLLRTKNKVGFKHPRVKVETSKNHLSAHQGTEVNLIIMPDRIEQSTQADNSEDEDNRPVRVSGRAVIVDTEEDEDDDEVESDDIDNDGLGDDEVDE